MRASTSASLDRAAACRVQIVQPIEDRAPALAGHAIGVGEVEHGIAAAAELHALVPGGKEPAAPQARIQRLVHFARRDQDDEGRQVRGLAPQAVVDPRPEARPAGDLRSGLEERDRRVVIDRVGDHRPDDAQVVHDAGGVRQETRQPRAAGAVSPEVELRAGQGQRRLIAGHARQSLSLSHRVGQLLAVATRELGLVVERVHLRRPAGHEQVDHALRPGGHVPRAAEHAAILDAGHGRCRPEEIRERQASQAEAHPVEQHPPRQACRRRRSGAAPVRRST